MLSYEIDKLYLKVLFSKKDIKKRPLVALHGWGRDHTSLLAMCEQLCEDRDVYLFDLPGFGHSPCPLFDEKIPTAQDIALIVLSRLKQEGLTEFDLLGHSFGGKVCFYMALESSATYHLILMASSGMKIKKNIRKRLRVFALKMSAKLLKKIDSLTGKNYFKNWFSPKFGSKDYLAAGAMRPVLVQSIQEDFSPLLSKLTTKTLLLWGEKDNDTPLEIAKRMNKNIPNATLITLPLASHLLMEESPSLCSYFIEKFLQDETVCS